MRNFLNDKTSWIGYSRSWDAAELLMEFNSGLLRMMIHAVEGGLPFQERMEVQMNQQPPLSDQSTIHTQRRRRQHLNLSERYKPARNKHASTVLKVRWRDR
jgi:hypothetical protein